MRNGNKWTLGGLMTAGVACLTLWLSGRNPFKDATPEVPVEINVLRTELAGRARLRLSVRNWASVPLHDVEIVGLDRNGTTSVFRRRDWPAGEVMQLGDREGWMAAEGAGVEVVAAGYRIKKQRF